MIEYAATSFDAESTQMSDEQDQTTDVVELQSESTDHQASSTNVESANAIVNSVDHQEASTAEMIDSESTNEFFRVTQMPFQSIDEFLSVTNEQKQRWIQLTKEKVGLAVRKLRQLELELKTEVSSAKTKRFLEWFKTEEKDFEYWQRRLWV